MKVILTRSHNAFDIGGINTYVWSIACELGRRGFDVHVISGCGKINTLDKYWIERFNGQIHVLKKGNFASMREQFLVWAIKGSRLVKELKPDIIHFNGMIPFLFSSVPSVATCHGLLNKSLIGLYLLYDKVSYGHFVDAIIALSERLRRELLKYLNIRYEKVVVIPLGFELDFFSSLYIEQRENAIMCGWGPIKNPKSSLKVFHDLNRRGLRCKLYVVGVNRNRALSSMPELAHLVKNKDIIFTGRLDRNRMVKLCQKVRCSLFPSLYESFSYGVLESFACGTPVVTSHAISDAVFRHGYGGFKTAPKDFSTMSSYVFNLLTDDELWKSINRFALKNVQKFSISKVVDALLVVYKDTINSKLSRR